MEQVAGTLGKKVLGQVTESEFWAALPELRSKCGDRAVLRAIHYFEENTRTLAQRDALQAGKFAAFAALVLESGRASFALCQNVYCSTDVRHQGLSVALALSQCIRQAAGAWRMQGAALQEPFRPMCKESLNAITARIEPGVRRRQLLCAAPAGTRCCAGRLKQQKEKHLRCDMYRRCFLCVRMRTR